MRPFTRIRRLFSARLFATGLCGLFFLTANAQFEPMFTQYMYNETFINPAYAGSHENIATTVLYRNQWAGMDGAPTTQTFNIHGATNSKKVGLGLSALNENIGVTHQFAAYADFAYRIVMPNSSFAFGLQGGFVNDEEKLTDVHTVVTGDNQFSTNVTKNFLPNFGFGMYYHTERFYAGLSIPRLLENHIDPTNPGKLSRNFSNMEWWHYYLATGCVVDLSAEVKFKPSIMIKAVQHAPVEFDADANFLIRDLLWIGCAYRTGDAVAGLIGLQLSKQLRIGYSYDYTLTDLQKYNSGSHEFTLSYDFGSAKNKIISTRYF